MGLANDAANLEMGPGNDAARLRTTSVSQDQRKCLRAASVRQDQRQCLRTASVRQDARRAQTTTEQQVDSLTSAFSLPSAKSLDLFGNPV